MSDSHRFARLTKRLNPKTDRVEWALVSKTQKDKDGDFHVLEYFGTQEPSDERVQKAEARVNWFSEGPGKKRKSFDLSAVASRVAFGGHQ